MSAGIDDGGPAFPTGTQVSQNSATGETTVHQYLSDGVSVRDYFAVHAPASLVGIDGWSVHQAHAYLGLPADVAYDWRIHYPALVAKMSYEYADAMLRARKA